MPYDLEQLFGADLICKKDEAVQPKKTSDIKAKHVGE